MLDIGLWLLKITLLILVPNFLFVTAMLYILKRQNKRVIWWSFVLGLALFNLSLLRNIKG
ncbi:MAG: hypothetical protein S4CHLAM81_04210 [Chlamydiales bacterium]|nr:hypothetical protein [Chlamydiales bacterium]MCH9635210.1 hypothetical protein [Chlamydiales bacterium]